LRSYQLTERSEVACFAFWQEGGIGMITAVIIWLQLKLDRRGVTALEYGLIAGVIVATITVGFRLLANSASTKFSTIGLSL
jgi:Flp pilus assembly pilin Flp